MSKFCAHEWDRYPSEPIVVSDEEFARNPLANFTPPRIVPCKKCGMPIDRGHYDRVISIPALREPRYDDEPRSLSTWAEFVVEHAGPGLLIDMDAELRRQGTTTRPWEILREIARAAQ